jgi:hypothetical protein
MTSNANTIKWTRHPLPAVLAKGTVLYSASGEFEFAGTGEFTIVFGSTIGKPYGLRFGTQFAGAYKTVSGAKAAAKRFGTWSN